MNCPKCQEKLIKEQYREKDYLLCFYCEGTWVNGKDIVTNSVLSKIEMTGKVTKHKCPSCAESNLKVANVLGLEIDYCSLCNGAFFDKGELEKISPNYKNIAKDQALRDTKDATTFLVAVSGAIGILFKAISR